jgi:hypothetical protein
MLLQLGWMLSCSQKQGLRLPSVAELAPPRGYQLARVITHFHSPYSWDACDKKGLSGGVPQAECLEHLRKALCLNHVNHVFLTDHPNFMADHEASELLLLQGADEPQVGSNGLTVSNRMRGCEDGFRPEISFGFEDQVIALGMDQHLSADPATRLTWYQQESSALRSELHTAAQALVVVPHTESRSVSRIQALQPDAIEIYNFHANIDPKIRYSSLNLPPFYSLANLLTYLVDPYNDLHPDVGFVTVLYQSPVYARIWNELLAAGLHVTGLGGSDSHENVFPQKVADGERFDSHRRVMRLISNHFLVPAVTRSAIKDAIRSGAGWLVFEALGSPVGMDYYAAQGSTQWSVGQTVSLGGAGGAVVLQVKAPQVYGVSGAISSRSRPLVQLRIRQVLTGGADQVVAESQGENLSWTVSGAGIYRAEVTLTPRHLREKLGVFESDAEREFPWVLTNPIYIDP